MQSRDTGGGKWTLRMSSQEKIMAIQRYVIQAAWLSEFSFLFICLVAGHVNPHTETSQKTNHQFKNENIFHGGAEKNRNTFEDDCREGKRVSG